MGRLNDALADCTTGCPSKAGPTWIVHQRKRAAVLPQQPGGDDCVRQSRRRALAGALFFWYPHALRLLAFNSIKGRRVSRKAVSLDLYL